MGTYLTPFASGVRPSGGGGWDGEGEDDGVPMRLLEALEAGADTVEGGAGSGTSLEATCQYRSKSSRGGRAAGSGLPEGAERHQRVRETHSARPLPRDCPAAPCASS